MKRVLLLYRSRFESVQSIERESVKILERNQRIYLDLDLILSLAQELVS